MYHPGKDGEPDIQLPPPRNLGGDWCNLTPQERVELVRYLKQLAHMEFHNYVMLANKFKVHAN